MHWKTLHRKHCIAATIGCNICAFLGMITGTYISSLTGDSPILLLGMEVYSVQYTTLVRAVSLTTMGLILVLKWRSFTPNDQIADVEQQKLIRRKFRQQAR